MFIRKYEPRRATAEEARLYFLQYHCDVPDALFGSVMEKESFLNAEAADWLDEALPFQRGKSKTAA